MKIHLTSSIRNFDEDIQSIHTIASIIKKNGGFIVQPWFDSVQDRKNRATTPEEGLNWEEIVEANIHACLEADTTIIEGSRFGYSQGYQAAIALQHNKPVLNLYRKDSPEYREWPDKLFVSGITHPLFANKAYSTEQELEAIVEDFLQNLSKKDREINSKFSLDSNTYQKLQKLMNESRRSEASTIKDVLSKALNEQ